MLFCIYYGQKTFWRSFITAIITATLDSLRFSSKNTLVQQTGAGAETVTAGNLGTLLGVLNLSPPTPRQTHDASLLQVSGNNWDAAVINHCEQRPQRLPSIRCSSKRWSVDPSSVIAPQSRCSFPTEEGDQRRRRPVLPLLGFSPKILGF